MMIRVRLRISPPTCTDKAAIMIFVRIRKQKLRRGKY